MVELGLTPEEEDLIRDHFRMKDLGRQLVAAAKWKRGISDPENQFPDGSARMLLRSMLQITHSLMGHEAMKMALEEDLPDDAPREDQLALLARRLQAIGLGR